MPQRNRFKFTEWAEVRPIGYAATSEKPPTAQLGILGASLLALAFGCWILRKSLLKPSKTKAREDMNRNTATTLARIRMTLFADG